MFSISSKAMASAFAGLWLAGCATPYQESGFMGGVSAQRVTNDTFMVSAHGNGYTDQATIAQYTLRKAAETTLSAGYEWFIVVNSENDSRSGAVIIPGRSTSTTSGNATIIGNSAAFNATTNTYISPSQAIPYIKPGVVATFRMGRGPPQPGAMLASEVAYNLTPKSVRQADLDSWVGVPLASLQSHPLFSALNLQRYPAADGAEIFDYVNGTPTASCHNRFTVKAGVVQRYEPRAQGQTKCFTDDSARPQIR